MDINNILSMLNLMQNNNKSDVLQNILNNKDFMQNIQINNSAFNNTKRDNTADIHHLVKSLYDKK